MTQQLFIDGQQADLGENTEVSFSVRSNLLSGAGEFLGNRSLTVTIPATVHNRRIIDMAQSVQGGGSFPYTFHNVDYYREGVNIVQGGIGRLMSATPNELRIVIVWGVRSSIEALLGSGKSLAELTTPAYIEFNAVPAVTDYNDALVDDVFYASLDTALHEGANTFYHTHVVVESGAAYDYTERQEASPYLHPSVRMSWLLSLMETQYGAHIDWGDAFDDIGTMIVPLIKKIPNDTTYNNGYRASTAEPSQMGGFGGNFIQLKTSNNSPIISQSTSDPQTIALTCATAFKGLVKYQLSAYINVADLVSVSYPIVKARYGYSIGLHVGDTWHWCPILPEGTYFNAHNIAGTRLDIYVTGYLAIEMAVGDQLSLRIGITSNGVFSPEIASDLHIQGGPLYISEIIGKENEVQPGQLYPVEGNIPDIKPIDLIKFLAAVTGVFPTQASTADTLVMAPVSSVFDWSRAVDWTGRLLSPSSQPVAAEKAFTADGWAQHNWWRWKEDDTVAGDYDGSIDVADETIEANRDIVTFPFAASDGNNVPVYSTEVRNGIPEIKYKAVQPRVLTMSRGENGEAVGNFDMDMKRIIAERYGDVAATMEHPAIITETIRINDVELACVDETRAIYIQQHGAYFALLELNVKGNGTAEAKLLRLKKQEE